MSQLEMVAADVPYLEAVEKTSFTPIGWLYGNIYEGLLQRGLVTMTTSFGAYVISDWGMQQLTAWRTCQSVDGMKGAGNGV